MVKKDQKWDWTKKQEEAFRELKEQFTKELVLAAPNLDKKNENGSGRVRLCNRRSAIYEVWGWKIEASSISLKVIE